MARVTSRFKLFFLLLAAILTSCTSVPITGRQQVNFVPEAAVLNMSFQQYDEFLRKHQLSSNQQQTRMVERVGSRIQRAVENYFRQNNLSHRLRNYQWEFNLVADKNVNAWALPGGKVVVYTGMFKVAQDETDLAVVIGHEVAHAVAGHGNERLSQSVMVQTGAIALGTALSGSSPATRELWMQAFGMGAQLGVMLPYSRLHETEADRLGLIFMAMAGYDPRQAVQFWQKMAAEKKGSAPPEFFSTHPSDQTRILNIQQILPEALRYYRRY